MGYVLSPPHVSNPEQAATRGGGVRSISLSLDALDRRELAHLAPRSWTSAGCAGAAGIPCLP